MDLFSNNNHSVLRHSIRLAVLTVAIIIGLVPGASIRAAMMPPDDAASLEPWLEGSGVSPLPVDTLFVAGRQSEVDTRLNETATQHYALHHGPWSGSAKAVDSLRRQNAGQIERRALAEFMGLTTKPGDEHGLSFLALQSCREYVAVNC